MTPPLHQAVYDGDLTEVKRLLSSPHVDVNGRDPSDYVYETPLITAAMYNTTPDITNVLLQHGANVALTVDGGWTAVMFACLDSDRHLPVLQALLNHHTGARVQLEDRDRDGETALMRTVYHNSPDCLRLLLDMGASTDGRYRDGRSVMGKARERGNTEVICVLDEHSRRTGELLSWW